MSNSFRYEIASALRDTIFFSGFAPKIEKVRTPEGDSWQVSATDIIKVNVFAPGKIVVSCKGKSKTFGSEFKAKNFIIDQILE